MKTFYRNFIRLFLFNFSFLFNTRNTIYIEWTSIINRAVNLINCEFDILCNWSFYIKNYFSRSITYLKYFRITIWEFDFNCFSSFGWINSISVNNFSCLYLSFKVNLYPCWYSFSIWSPHTKCFINHFSRKCHLTIILITRELWWCRATFEMGSRSYW